MRDVGNINYFANTRIPTEKAHGRQIAEMVNAFNISGHDTTLIVPSRYQSNDTLKSTNYSAYYGIEKPKIRYISFFDELSPWIVRNKLSKFFFYLRTIYNVVYLLMFTKRKDLLYTREFLVAALYRLSGREVVYEIHQLDTAQLSQKVVKTLIRISPRTISQMPVVAISSTLKNELILLGFEKVCVAHDGSRSASCAGNSKLDFIRTFDLLYTGHLFPEKGVDLVIQAAKKFPNLSVGIIGGLDKDIQKYREIINNQQLKNVHLLGHLCHDRVRAFQKKAKILLLPQLDETAQSPMKLFEYMDSGVPIIASATRPIKEVIDNKLAYMFEPSDIDQLNSCITKILANPNEAMRKASKAKKVVSDSYTWDVRVKKIINWYTKL